MTCSIFIFFFCCEFTGLVTTDRVLNCHGGQWRNQANFDCKQDIHIFETEPRYVFDLRPVADLGFIFGGGARVFHNSLKKKYTLLKY